MVWKELMDEMKKNVKEMIETGKEVGKASMSAAGVTKETMEVGKDLVKASMEVGKEAEKEFKGTVKEAINHTKDVTGTLTEGLTSLYKTY
jgi:methyl-accepting chemotaxis protein